MDDSYGRLLPTLFPILPLRTMAHLTSMQSVQLTRLWGYNVNDDIS